MSVSNVKLRTRRERTPSQAAPGESMGRAELADAVNQYLWESTGRYYQLDAHTIARYERGAVRWPSAHHRSGLRHVLGAASDAELGFHPTRRGNTYDSGSAKAIPSTAPNPLGAASLGETPTRFLSSTTVDTPIPARIGWPEVEHVRATARGGDGGEPVRRWSVLRSVACPTALGWTATGSPSESGRISRHCRGGGQPGRGYCLYRVRHRELHRSPAVLHLHAVVRRPGRVVGAACQHSRGHGTQGNLSGRAGHGPVTRRIRPGSDGPVHRDSASHVVRRQIDGITSPTA